MLWLTDPATNQLGIASDALPRNLRRLRLTEDGCNDHLGSVYDEFGDAAPLASLPRNFASLHHLQHLQLTAHGWGEDFMPEK